MTTQRRPPRGSSEDAEDFRDDIDWYIRLWAFAAQFGMGSLTRVRVEGDEELAFVPKHGPLIVASNHASNADGVAIGGWLVPRLGRRVHWLGKREMTEAPIIGPLARHGSIHPVDRAGADVDAFRLAQRILDTGHVLVVFPEGTRSPDGKLQPAKDGVALLTLRSRAPILPVGISGSNRFWPKGSFPHLGGAVTLRIGRTFTLADALGEEVLADRRKAKSLATDTIMRRIAALLPERQRGAYAWPSEEPIGVSADHMR